MCPKCMLPSLVRDAAGRRVPLPIGCVERHGHHLPVGWDTTIVEKLLRRLEKRIECIMAPTVKYGQTGYAVPGPERSGP